MLQIVSKLKGYSIEAKDGTIGAASDFLFDDSSLKVRWLVVDPGSWLTGRKILIHPSAIGYAEHWRRELTVGLTKAQVQNSPDIAEDLPVSLQMQNDLYGYYDWESPAGGSLYGAGIYDGGAWPSAPRSYRGETAIHGGDPHLRSIAEVTGYHVHATDGGIGYIENFIIDSESWVVRYLAIDTSNWWFGQHVLISAHAVKEVDWPARYIRLDIARDQIKASPPWNPADQIDKEFENRLYSHYDWPTDERQSPFENHERRQ